MELFAKGPVPEAVSPGSVGCIAVPEFPAGREDPRVLQLHAGILPPLTTHSQSPALAGVGLGCRKMPPPTAGSAERLQRRVHSLVLLLRTAHRLRAVAWTWRKGQAPPRAAAHCLAGAPESSPSTQGAGAARALPRHGVMGHRLGAFRRDLPVRFEAAANHVERLEEHPRVHLVQDPNARSKLPGRLGQGQWTLVLCQVPGHDRWPNRLFLTRPSCVRFSHHL
mmetsp:Transcript_24480/g.43985  ORF Transcript_24480/g.43985 Transcript_24480/m.43985 type:complete len:223 (+) Transcript_24480:376-1044(+)